MDYSGRDYGLVTVYTTDTPDTWLTMDRQARNDSFGHKVHPRPSRQ